MIKRLFAIMFTLVVLVNSCTAASETDESERSAEQKVLEKILAKISLKGVARYQTRVVMIDTALKDGEIVRCFGPLTPSMIGTKPLAEKVLWKLTAKGGSYLVFVNSRAYHPVDMLDPPDYGLVALVSTGSFKVIQVLNNVNWRRSMIVIESSEGKKRSIIKERLLYDGMLLPVVSVTAEKPPPLDKFEIDDVEAIRVYKHFLASDRFVRSIRRAAVYGELRNVAPKNGNLWRACEKLKKTKDNYVACAATVFLSDQKGNDHTFKDKEVSGVFIVWVRLQPAGEFELSLEQLWPQPHRSVTRKISLHRTASPTKEN